MSFFFPFPALKSPTVAMAMLPNFALGKKKIKFLKFTNLHSFRVYRLFFFFFFYGVLLFSNVDQQDSLIVKYDTEPLEIKKIDKKYLELYTNNPDFDYDYEIMKQDISWWQDFKTWLNNIFQKLFTWIFGIGKAVGYLAILFKIIPYILLLLLLFLLIKFFLNVNSRSILQSKKNQALVSLSEEERIIKNDDIQQLIQKALTDENYRLAVRYYYLYILQLMSEKELITWELQKTNDDYLNEIKKQDLKQDFTKITRLYDYIWYGNFDIDEAKYSRAETAFLSLQRMVNNG